MLNILDFGLSKLLYFIIAESLCHFFITTAYWIRGFPEPQWIIKSDTRTLEVLANSQMTWKVTLPSKVPCWPVTNSIHPVRWGEKSEQGSHMVCPAASMVGAHYFHDSIFQAHESHIFSNYVVLLLTNTSNRCEQMVFGDLVLSQVAMQHLI